MPVRQKLRPKVTAPAVSRALRHLLTWGDSAGAHRIAEADGTNAWELLINSRDEDREAWHAIEADGLPQWIERYPGTRPWSWWQFSAPELRQLTGGTYNLVTSPHGRCFATGVPHIAQFLADPPLVEPEAAYLDRLDLWTPGERARVPAAAFVPRVFSVELLKRDEHTNPSGD